MTVKERARRRVALRLKELTFTSKYCTRKGMSLIQELCWFTACDGSATMQKWKDAGLCDRLFDRAIQHLKASKFRHKVKRILKETGGHIIEVSVLQSSHEIEDTLRREAQEEWKKREEMGRQEREASRSRRGSAL